MKESFTIFSEVTNKTSSHYLAMKPHLKNKFTNTGIVRENYTRVLYYSNTIVWIAIYLCKLYKYDVTIYFYSYKCFLEITISSYLYQYLSSDNTVQTITPVRPYPYRDKIPSNICSTTNIIFDKCSVPTEDVVRGM